MRIHIRAPIQYCIDDRLGVNGAGQQVLEPLSTIEEHRDGTAQASDAFFDMSIVRVWAVDSDSGRTCVPPRSGFFLCTSLHFQLEMRARPLCQWASEAEGEFDEIMDALPLSDWTEDAQAA